MLVIGQCNRTVKGTQWTRYAYVSGQNASWACAVVLHFAELTIDFFYENVQLISSFFLKFCNSSSCCPILSVIILMINKLDSCLKAIWFCFCIITDQIGLHSVLLLLLIHWVDNVIGYFWALALCKFCFQLKLLPNISLGILHNG